jgi:NADPH:quinone reductase-like Zn-dependent oxidoreductase
MSRDSKDEESFGFEKREDSPISQDWAPPEVLQLDELPLPAPDKAEVRLRVKAIGLNRAQVHFRQDRYRFPPVLPSKIGYEASGIVEAVGRDVNRSWLGKTVSALPAFPANKYGVYGEVAIVPATAIAE